MTRVADRIAALVVAAGCAFSVALLPRIPHYRLMIPWVLPAAALVSYVILRNIGRHSSQGSRQAPIIGIALNAVNFIIALHVLMLANLTGMAWARALGPRAVFVLFGVVIAINGNLLPRTGPNLAVGIRTRRAIADPRLWSRLHRLGGYLTVAFGCVIAASGLLLRGSVAGVAVSASAFVMLVSLGVGYWRLTHD